MTFSKLDYSNLVILILDFSKLNLLGLIKNNNLLFA